MSIYELQLTGVPGLAIDDDAGQAYVRLSDQRGNYINAYVPESERQAAAQALAGDGYRVVRASPVDDKFIAVERDEYERLLKEAQAAQSDRPEPVNPASVRVGDVVEIDADDGSWMVRAPVTDTDDPEHDGPRYPQDSPFGVKVNRLMWWPKLDDATVRVLHRPVAEPDPAAVETLAEVIYEHEYDQVTGRCNCGVDSDGDHAKHLARVLVGMSADA